MDLDFAKNVGYAFIKEYYGKCNGRSAAELCHMYSKESTYMRYSKDETTPKIAAFGVDSIRAHLANIPKTKFALTYVDCCPSVHGSILISVEGTAMTEASSCEFHQTFIISPNAYSSDTYYIHNDLTRVCTEEASAPHVQEVAPPAPPSPPAPPVPAAYVQPSPPPVDDMEAAIEPTQVEHEIINNVIDEVMGEKEEELPVVDLISKSIKEREVPDEDEQEEVEEAQEEDEPAEDEDMKEEDNAPKSYASVLGRLKASDVKTQVISGGSVPNAAKKRKEPERKKPVGDMVALNLISSVRANGKGAKGAKGGKGAKGESNNRGQAPKKDEEKKFTPHANSLYIRNLPKDFTDEDCEKVFGVFGKLTGKTIRAAEGYAFIDFDTKASMEKALAKPVSFGAISLSVQEKKSQAQRIKEKEEANRNRNTRREQRN
eukprot:TRINITY_DN311_c0_g1_i1.p1 TRINITY_DN311_c0_g1~~TRINITY_DN311_c0_g1_i1.p1  ORF type:complete len:431 (+),score=178.56 TRINITY_DN311_c0_g1_i1:53-1345(+)